MGCTPGGGPWITGAGPRPRPPCGAPGGTAPRPPCAAAAPLPCAKTPLETGSNLVPIVIAARTAKMNRTRDHFALILSLSSQLRREWWAIIPLTWHGGCGRPDRPMPICRRRDERRTAALFEFLERVE